MDNNKMKEIFSDKAFVDKLISMKDNDAVLAALKAKGLELTDKDIASIRELQAKVKSGEVIPEQTEPVELSDDMLENVSGGFMFLLGALVKFFSDDDDQDSTGTTAHNSGASGGW